MELTYSTRVVPKYNTLLCDVMSMKTIGEEAKKKKNKSEIRNGAMR